MIKHHVVYEGSEYSACWKEYLERNKLSILLKENCLDVVKKLDLVEIKIETVNYEGIYNDNTTKQIWIFFDFEGGIVEVEMGEWTEAIIREATSKLDAFAGRSFRESDIYRPIFSRFIREINDKFKLNVPLFE